MRPSEALQLHRKEIRSIVEQHHARNPRVFGSVLHGTDVDGSDLDLLIDPTSKTTLMDIGAIRYELRELLGVSVGYCDGVCCAATGKETNAIASSAFNAKFQNKVVFIIPPVISMS